MKFKYKKICVQWEKDAIFSNLYKATNSQYISFSQKKREKNTRTRTMCEELMNTNKNRSKKTKIVHPFGVFLTSFLHERQIHSFSRSFFILFIFLKLLIALGCYFSAWIGSQFATPTNAWHLHLQAKKNWNFLCWQFFRFFFSDRRSLSYLKRILIFESFISLQLIAQHFFLLFQQVIMYQCGNEVEKIRWKNSETKKMKNSERIKEENNNWKCISIKMKKKTCAKIDKCSLFVMSFVENAVHAVCARVANEFFIESLNCSFISFVNSETKNKSNGYFVCTPLIGVVYWINSFVHQSATTTWNAILLKCVHAQCFFRSIQ